MNLDSAEAYLDGAKSQLSRTVDASKTAADLGSDALFYSLLGEDEYREDAEYLTDQDQTGEVVKETVSGALRGDEVDIGLVKDMLRKEFYDQVGEPDPRAKGMAKLGSDMARYAVLSEEEVDPAAENLVDGTKAWLKDWYRDGDAESDDLSLLESVGIVRDAFAYDQEGSREDIDRPEVESLWSYGSAFFSNKGGERTPATLSVDITPKCNLRCDFGGEKCYFYANEEEDWAWNEKEGLSVKEWSEVIEEFQEEHPYARQAIFVGGEPMFRKDDILELADEHFAGVGIVSNGVHQNGLFDPDDYEDVNANFNVMLSIDGPREQHDQNRGEGVFDEAMEAAEETDASVVANTSIGPPIMDGMEDLVEQAYGSLDGIRFSGWTPRKGNQHFTDKQQHEFVDKLHKLKDRMEEKYENGDFIQNSRTELEMMRPENQEYVFEDLCPIRTTEEEMGMTVSLGYDGSIKGMCVIDNSLMEENDDPEPDCSECLCDAVTGWVSGAELANMDMVDFGLPSDDSPGSELTEKLARVA